MSGFEPLSAFADGPCVGGVPIPLLGIDRRVEVKVRAIDTPPSPSGRGGRP
jgi:hypothetical protein